MYDRLLEQTLQTLRSSSSVWTTCVLLHNALTRFVLFYYQTYCTDTQCHETMLDALGQREHESVDPSQFMLVMSLCLVLLAMFTAMRPDQNRSRLRLTEDAAAAKRTASIESSRREDDPAL